MFFQKKKKLKFSIFFNLNAFISLIFFLAANDKNKYYRKGKLWNYCRKKWGLTRTP